ncbi:MAG: PHP domain-containing protein [Clostridia bacterium]|nr:PHP domain-containing protein [Clostridia bacterium]
MEKLFCDLHIHSCLSPCGSDDMTPSNICGMAMLKGLDMIALTDHNTARNLPAMKICAEAYGLTLIPGMEITTREEVHLLGYFPDVETALEFSEFLRGHMPAKKNKPSFFGNQLVMDEDDNVIAEEDELLIGAADLSLSELVKLIREAGGVPVPAHINRGSNGLLINLGFVPEDLDLTAVEVWRDLPCAHTPQEGRVVLHSSDAHYLGDILEARETIELPERTVEAFLDHLRGGRRASNKCALTRLQA